MIIREYYSPSIYAKAHNAFEFEMKRIEIRKANNYYVNILGLLQRMAMKKQASLLSFFSRSPNPKCALQDEPTGNQTVCKI